MQFASLAIQGAHEKSIVIPQDWTQGRSAFGGLVSAIAYNAARAAIESDASLKSLYVSFVGPIDAARPLYPSVRVLRRGKSVTQIQVDLQQAGDTVLLLVAAFGVNRQSAIAAPPDEHDKVPAPEACKELQFMVGVTPAFTQHFDYRFHWGGFPFSGNRSPAMGGWIRYRQPEQDFSWGHVLGLLDAWPPAVLPWLSKPAPASSLTWMVDIVQSDLAYSALDWFLYKAEILHAASGYAVIDARLWGPDGKLLAIGRQCVTVFA